MKDEIRPWAKALRGLCLKKLRDFGGKGTARQICDDTGKSVEIVTPRLTELAALRVIRDTGERVPVGRGRPQKVWALVDLNPDFDPDCDIPENRNVTHQDAPEWFQRFGL